MWESELDHWKLEPTPTSYCCFIIDAFYHHCFLDFGLINYHQRICCFPCCESHELLRKPSVGSGKLDPFCELSSRPLSPYIILQTSQSLYCPPTSQSLYYPPDLSVPILWSRPLSAYTVLQTSQSLYCPPDRSDTTVCTLSSLLLSNCQTWPLGDEALLETYRLRKKWQVSL